MPIWLVDLLLGRSTCYKLAACMASQFGFISSNHVVSRYAEIRGLLNFEGQLNCSNDADKWHHVSVKHGIEG